MITDATALRELTRDLAAGAAEADRTATLSAEGIRRAHEAGMLTHPTSDGSGEPGASTEDFARGFMALGAGDPSVALVALMTAIQQRLAVTRGDWPEELHRKILRESAERPVLINAARAEPALGSAARGGKPATTMKRTADGWVLNGRKRFITGAEHLDYHVVWALDPDTGETGRLIVPAGSPGVEVVVGQGMTGMRASSTHDVDYRDVLVPADHLCHSGAAEITAPAQEFEIGVAALYLGIAQSARDTLVKFLTTRSPSGLGTPLAEIDRIQLEVGAMQARLIEAESVLISNARLIDQLTPGSTPSAEEADRLTATKYLCTTAAIDVIQLAVRLGGGYALAAGGDLERNLRDVLCSRPHPPQDDVTLRALGRRALNTVSAPAHPVAPTSTTSSKPNEGAAA